MTALSGKYIIFSAGKWNKKDKCRERGNWHERSFNTIRGCLSYIRINKIRCYSVYKNKNPKYNSEAVINGCSSCNACIRFR